MSTLKVDGIRSNSASSDAITLASDGTCTANITNRTNRNLIINGAMQVAQRGTSATSSTNGYHTVDRWGQSNGGLDEAATMAQVDVASGTTPYTLGFRKAYKVTNGNQTGGAGAGDYYRIYYFTEAQDAATSGWNYTSNSDYITVSCWVKSSVAQNFYIELRTQDGTAQAYVWETGSLTANTWTKITKTIPGNTNIQIDNDTAHGPGLFIHLFQGTDFTGSFTLNQWAAYNSSVRAPAATSTWYTTNDATFEITGVQLEVGSVATDFEHRSYGQELQLCNRYYYDVLGPAPETDFGFAVGGRYNATYNFCVVNFPVQMRAVPTLESSTTTNAFYKIVGGVVDDYDTHLMSKGGLTGARIFPNAGSDDHGSNGDAVVLHANNTSACQLRFNAEL